MSTPEREIAEFFQQWSTGFDEMCDAYRNALGDSATWIAGPSPIPVTHGGEEAVGLLKGFRASHDLTTIDVDILHLGQAGDIVYSERIDHLVDHDEVLGLQFGAGAGRADAGGRDEGRGGGCRYGSGVVVGSGRAGWELSRVRDRSRRMVAASA